MTQSDILDIWVLDPDWRPRHRVPLEQDWCAVIPRLLAYDGQWLALDQWRMQDGDALPRSGDIALTRALTRRLRPLDMRLADHVIRVRGKQFSFRAAGLL